MLAALDSLSNNPLIVLGSFALAILGMLLAVFIFFRSQRNKTPCFDRVNNTIIEGLHKSLDGLEVHYKGSAQERVTVTKLLFWNQGRDTIDRSDLVEKDKLRVVSPDQVEVLDIKIIYTSTESCAVELGEQTNEGEATFFPITFDFLDHKDHFVIQIVHNGSSDKDFSIEGKIKGVKNLLKPDVIRHPKSKLQSTLKKFLPLSAPMEQLIENPFFMKYFGSLIYLAFAGIAVWNLFIGNTAWYVWLAGIFFIIISLALYFGVRHIPPMKI